MILNTGQCYTVEQKDIVAWKYAYPVVDVDQEIRAMTAWCHSNPKNRKTKSGIKRFINAWLGKARAQGGSSPFARNQVKKDRLRDKTIEMQLTDITWLDPEAREAAKVFYLQKYGYYYDGEIIYQGAI